MSINDRTGQVITLRDARRLSFAEYGDPRGIPVFFFAGLNNARFIRHPDDSIVASLGIRLISVGGLASAGRIFSHVDTCWTGRMMFSSSRTRSTLNDSPSWGHRPVVHTRQRVRTRSEIASPVPPW